MVQSAAGSLLHPMDALRATTGGQTEAQNGRNRPTINPAPIINSVAQPGEEGFKRDFSCAELRGFGGEEEDKRTQWDHPLQFFFTLLGYCVGLGNIWRFPYLCQKNGGGAFIIPFMIMMVLEGMPILLLELAVGQRFRTGAYGAWNMVNGKLGGIGLASALVAAIVGCYYNVIIAWTVFYLFNSFKGTLPWSTCPVEEMTVANGTMMNATVLECELSSETQYFWYRYTLDSSSGITDLDGVRWWILVCLFLSWVIVYLVVMQGIQSSGKVVYIIASFPYVVLGIFLVKGLTLDGAAEGLLHVFYPKMDKLMSASVWMDAANQVFYSYGLALGSMISFGSYNPPGKDCIKDVLVLTATNVFTAVYACAVIFAILGYKAKELFNKCMHEDVEFIFEHYPTVWSGRTPEDILPSEYEGLVVAHALNITKAEFNVTLSKEGIKGCTLEEEMNNAAGGTGLAFIVMADVFTSLPLSQFWSVLFFLMLFSLGLGSQIGIIEGFQSTLFDLPSLKGVSRPLLTAISCGSCFLVGIVFTTGAGEYWLTLFDSYGALGLSLIALVEVIAMMHVYGYKQFIDDVEEMTGRRPSMYWRLCWRVIAPLLLIILLVFSVVSQLLEYPKYNVWNKAEARTEEAYFPPVILAFATFLACASLVPIIVVFILRYFDIWPLDTVAFKVPMSRINTCASMLPVVPELRESPMREMLNFNGSRRNSEDSDTGLQVRDPPNAANPGSGEVSVEAKAKDDKGNYHPLA